MYVPRFNAVEDEATIRAFVTDSGAADLVTTGREGYPVSTLLPVAWEDDRVIAHFARANPHWKEIEPGAPALLVCRGAQAHPAPHRAGPVEHSRSNKHSGVRHLPVRLTPRIFYR
ncbi:FMN-binding negative transcriptional regulator [Nocardioides sp.]|uniref:FMN-binding negative transcriptional regulator n=1 Tax=Nocardioides sp. TaxID=35761 RepID=UPI001A32C491|nr:FMN-binding negative transcriptional regulator [Nocardioides sp.]MBJ7356545.1 FMN-binding negative transcriptional regulator [Nocardioides sp.]